ncbi:FkbM family methyltransferase [Klebsiella pneumoniae]|uniref:FkbM family methyltransferase n=1 Tax=Klebsiella pneumoniae TaxID=573 RepID=UPI00115DF927|nr:FkbM family methyltransferase [Klebsiella pneumoniae]
MTFISYAQNLEDVMLWRVLHDFGPGFYIDVGACDPVADSVTKAFYDAGWHGINIEPMDVAFERVALAREKDINLKVALGAQQGKVTFYSVDEGNALSTSVEALATKYIKEGRKVDEINVQVETLAHICEQYAEGEIHFLKIDVEGGERCVLEGADFVNYRPWIILVESTEPNSTKPSYATWEPILLDASYSFVYFDGLNRFYVANEKMEALAEGFSCPPNWFDCYQKNDYVKLGADFEQIKKQLSEIEMNIESLPQTFLPELSKKETLSKKIGELVSNHASVAQMLEQKETELSHCKHRLTSLSEEKETLSEEIGKLVSSHASVAQMLEQKETELSHSKHRLDSLSEEIAVYKARVDRELDACYQELYESSRHIGVLARDRNIAMSNVAVRDATVAAQSQHIEELEQKVHDLYHSTSWKVTRPLRLLSRLMTKAGLKK